MSSRLGDALSAPDTKSRYVRRLFATIAERYDLITRLLWYGQDRRWKARLVTLSAAAPGTRALDLACGTGDIAFALAARGAQVSGLDITFRMLQLARAKGSAASFLAGDMLALPFRDGEFDLVTAGYGLRNVPDIPRALTEIRRVLKPGGRFLSLGLQPARGSRFARRLSRISDAGRGHARSPPAPRPGHLPLHSRVHPSLPRRSQGQRDD